MKIFLAFLATAFFSPVKADYGYMKLSELVCNADYGAVGTIVKVDKNYFYLEVEEYVLNNLDLDTLTISKFEDWACATRFDKYKVGQKEMVFFRKSNYVIDDYELLGYGAGDEFELPIIKDTIRYQSGFNRFESYGLREFVMAIKDYAIVVASAKASIKTLNKSQQIEFSKKSALHKVLIECRTFDRYKNFEVPAKGNIVNLERYFIYKNYENKILVNTNNHDSVYLTVEDADVWRHDNYFIVKPKGGWARRKINVHSVNTIDERDILFTQIFDVIELPEPSVYFGYSVKDTLFFSYFRDAIPTVGYYLDEYHKDDNLEYELLSYDYDIISGDTKEKFSLKSSRGTNEFQDRLQRLKTGDIIEVSNIFVLYPNREVRKLRPKTVVVKKEE